MNKRGRKAAAPAEVVDVPMDAVALQQAGAAATELRKLQGEHEAEVRAVAQRLGYELPADCTDPDLIQRDICTNMRRSAEAMLEVGRGLAVLKAACEHGQFAGRLEALGIDARVARKFIQAAAKFSKRSAPTVLTAAGSQSKLFELLVLDDDQIGELELTGQTGELALDDVASMTQKELRAAVREARAQKEADRRTLQKVIEGQSQKINELVENDARRANTTNEQWLKKLQERTLSAELALKQLMVTVDDAMTNARNEPCALAASQSLDYLCSIFADLAEGYGITLKWDQHVLPLHMQPLHDMATSPRPAEAKG